MYVWQLLGTGWCRWVTAGTADVGRLPICLRRVLGRADLISQSAVQTDRPKKRMAEGCVPESRAMQAAPLSGLLQLEAPSSVCWTFRFHTRLPCICSARNRFSAECGNASAT